MDIDNITDQWAETARENLRAAIDTAGMSAREVARRARIPSGTLSAQLAGSDRVTLRVLSAVAPVLGLGVDDILGTRVAVGHVRLKVRGGGVVSQAPSQGRFVLVLAEDHCELGLRAEDLLTLDCDEGVREGRLVLVDEGDGVARLHRVRSVDPLILARQDGPAVVYDERYHRVIAGVVSLHRRDP